MYPRIVYIFFSLPLPFLPLLSTALQLLVFIFSCCRLTSDVFSALSLLVPPSLVPVLPISYITTRLTSLARCLQLHCHPSCFSFCYSGAASIYTLMMRLQTGTSCKSLERAPKRSGSTWWPGLVTFSMLGYGGLCVLCCLVYSDVLPYYSSSS